jgi:hypothetical protein
LSFKIRIPPLPPTLSAEEPSPFLPWVAFSGREWVGSENANKSGNAIAYVSCAHVSDGELRRLIAVYSHSVQIFCEVFFARFLTLTTQIILFSLQNKTSKRSIVIYTWRARCRGREYRHAGTSERPSDVLSTLASE